MSRIPRELARRIDRLAGRAHAFHRFAHHPLCGAYRREVLIIGKIWVCKGCAFAALGLIAGSIAGAALPVMESGILLLAVLFGCAGFGVLLVRRFGKVATRLFPAATLGFLVIQGLLRFDVAGGIVVGLGLGFLALAIARYRHRGPWRGACEACLEREQRPCSGFRRQVRRERAFQRRVGRLLT